MYAELKSFGIHGLAGFAVSVEADITGGLPNLSIVGLPDSAVKESADRVRAALKNLGYKWPDSRITINLAPADVKKTGPLYDLPVFLATLCASGQLATPAQDAAFLGELALDGALRPVVGVLPMALAAQDAGIATLFVPQENAVEAACATSALTVYGVSSAKQVVQHLNGEAPLAPTPPANFVPEDAWRDVPDFADVRGQLLARRAVEIAAAGGHNMIMIGVPGSGKSMVAKRLPSILPPLTRGEAIEATKVYSIAGLVPAGAGLVRRRPFRHPHHSTSAVALAGGGANFRPGEVSLAHGGVLFLDELPEFNRDSLEVLRQPIEDGSVTISRIAGSATYPSRFMLIAAMNGCKCGFLGHPTHPCTCSLSTIERYRARVSGPILDRIDLHVEMCPVEYDDLAGDEQNESSAEIRKRVLAARALQTVRYRKAGFVGVHCNADLSSAQVRTACKLTPKAEATLRRAYDAMGLSARAYDRIMRVSRTIADLAGEDVISEQSLLEALGYRALDRKIKHVAY